MRTRHLSACTALAAVLVLSLFAGVAGATPTNDAFAYATGTTGQQNFGVELTGATAEAGEPVATSAADHTVWYRWTAPSDGFMRASDCVLAAWGNSVPGQWVAVWSGESVDALTKVDESHGGCPSGMANAQTARIPVSAGGVYMIQVGAPAGPVPVFSFPLYVDFSAAIPANDDWSSATALSAGLPQTTDLNNSMAQADSDEPGYNPGFGQNSVWYSWTPAQSGVVSADLCASNYVYQVSMVDIYSAGGDPVVQSGLNHLAGNVNGCPPPKTQLSHAYAVVEAGKSYWIRVANSTEFHGYPYSLRLRWVESIENSVEPDIVNPEGHRVGTPLYGRRGLWGSPLVGTPDTTIQWQRCAPDGVDCTDIDGANAGFYTPVADDLGSRIRLKVTASDGANSLDVTTKATKVVDTAPANDFIASAFDLGGSADVIFDDDATFATSEPGESGPGGSPAQHTVWYSWTAPSTGKFAVGTCANAPDPDPLHLKIAVFTGDGTIAGSTLAAGATSGCGAGHRARTMLSATEGTKYWMQVDADDNDEAPFKLVIAPAGAPYFTGNADISGDLLDGGTLHVSHGTYNSALDVQLAYQWALCDDNGNSCVDVAGADGTDLVLGPDAVGKRARATVSMTSGAGSAEQDQLTAVIQADDDGDGIGDLDDECPGEAGSDPPGNGCLPSAVVNDALPQLSGSPKVGQTLTLSNGSWHTLHNPLTLSFGYGWARCASADDSDCTGIAGAFSNSYVLTSADIGKYIWASVAASNNDDMGHAETAFYGPVAAATADPGQPAAPVDPVPAIGLPKSLGAIRPAKSGRFALPKFGVICGPTASGPCTGTLKIVTKKSKAVRSQKLSFALSAQPGTTAGHEFKLTARALKALKKAKSLKASISVSFGAPGFSQKTAGSAAVFKAP